MAGRLHLVTGAMGFTGAHVVRELLARGERVLATDLPRAVADPALREILARIGLDASHPGLAWLPADLLDPKSLAPLFERRPTHVFHVASLYDYSASLERLLRVNVEGTRNLLAAAAGAPLERWLHWSTCGVYGKPYTAAEGARVNVPLDERGSSPRTAPPDAEGPEGTHLVNAYSVSKWRQEQLVWRAHRERDLPLTVIRPAPIYGPGSSYGHGGIALAVAQGLVPLIPADARNFVNASVHVEDVARFACFAIDAPATRGEDYNVADASVISFAEFLRHLALLSGRRLREVPGVRQRWLRPLMVGGARLWGWLARRHGVPRVRVFEVQSAPYVSSSYWISNRKSLAAGFAYRYPDVRVGMEDTLAWMRDAGWLLDRGRLLVEGGGGSKPA